MKDILKKKCLSECSKRSCSCTTMPRLNLHVHPTRKWYTWDSSVLITYPNLRIWPRRTTTCSLNRKAIEKSPFFVRNGYHCCPGDLVGRTNL